MARETARHSPKFKTSLDPHSTLHNSPRYARSTSPRPAPRRAPLQVTLLHPEPDTFTHTDIRVTGGAMQDEAVEAQLIKPYMVAQRSITSTSGAPPLASTPQQPHVAFSLTRICER